MYHIDVTIVQIQLKTKMPVLIILIVKNNDVMTNYNNNISKTLKYEKKKYYFNIIKSTCKNFFIISFLKEIMNLL